MVNVSLNELVYELPKPAIQSVSGDILGARQNESFCVFSVVLVMKI